MSVEYKVKFYIVFRVNITEGFEFRQHPPHQKYFPVQKHSIANYTRQRAIMSSVQTNNYHFETNFPRNIPDSVLLYIILLYTRTDNLKMGCGAVCHYHLKKSIPCHVEEEWRPVYHKSQIPDITCKCYNFSFKQVMTLGFFFIWKSGA